MADVLNILVLPTYNLNTIAVADISSYDDPLTIVDPFIEIVVPDFETVTLAFVPETVNVFNSTDLGITTAGNEQPLPDGIYCLTYTIDPADESHTVEKSIIRVDKLQEKFDEAFMQLDMMECDRAIKKQAKVNLTTIWFFIQGAIAAANNCATDKSTKLYIQADTMLDNFINSNCGCTGNNYVINFQ